MDLLGQTIGVVGLGISGQAMCRLAQARGAHVRAVDTRTGVSVPEGVEAHLGRLDGFSLDGLDRLLVSPGVQTSGDVWSSWLSTGIRVSGEPSFALEILTAPLIGITGTNGKSSVTQWTGDLLAAAGVDAFVGGNLGVPLSTLARHVHEGRVMPEALVVEFSSYQLERAEGIRPVAAAWLNLTPDHLARHGTMEAYARAKAGLFREQTVADLAILPDHVPLVDEAMHGCGDAKRLRWGTEIRREGRVAEVELASKRITIGLEHLGVQGAFNLDHAVTAATLALGWARAVGDARVTPDALTAAMAEISALPHRMQVVPTADGVMWVNDSKATNVAAAAGAIGGLERTAVVLLGGEPKGDDVGELAPLLHRHRAVICFGAAREAFQTRLASCGVQAHQRVSMRDAVMLAREMAQDSDAILLSPACASFDEFQNFAARGESFAALARGEG